MFVVRYSGPFGFIKPWTAVRDNVTTSLQFLTPSVVEGIEKKLFPELLKEIGIRHIIRYKLCFESMCKQKEVTQARGYNGKNSRTKSIIERKVLVHPELTLAFASRDLAERACAQHICLCRNEDLMLPDGEIVEMSEDEFDALSGFELRFGDSGRSFMVGYNRYDAIKPMYGSLEFNGKSLL